MWEVNFKFLVCWHWYVTMCAWLTKIENSSRSQVFLDHKLIWVKVILALNMLVSWARGKASMRERGVPLTEINSKNHLGSGIKDEGPQFFFFRARFDFCNIFYTSGIEMSQHFQGPFGPLLLSLHFEGPHQIFRVIGPRACLIGTPDTKYTKR